jgi:hypothetical protein
MSTFARIWTWILAKAGIASHFGKLESPEFEYHGVYQVIRDIATFSTFLVYIRHLPWIYLVYTMDWIYQVYIPGIYQLEHDLFRIYP